jgi:rubrerythrin
MVGKAKIYNDYDYDYYMQTEGKKIKCRLCGHEWPYKGDAKEPTCPSCHRKTPNPYFRRK